MVIETSLLHFDVMNRDQSPALKATCIDGRHASYITVYSYVERVDGRAIPGQRERGVISCDASRKKHFQQVGHGQSNGDIT